MNEFHLKIICDYCKRSYAKEVVEEHKRKCDQIMEECSYCTILVSKGERIDHEVICGATTEQCTKCLHYIAKKDIIMHQSINCCPDELEVSKQLVYIDDKRNKKRLKKDKVEGNKEVSENRPANYSSNSNTTMNSTASYKKFDMQVKSIKDKELPQANQSQYKENNINKGLGKQITKPAFANKDFKLNSSSNNPSQSIDDKPAQKKESKPKMNKMSSFKNVIPKETNNLNEVNKNTQLNNNNKKKKKKQFLPLNKYDKVDVSDDEYDEEDYTISHKSNPYQGISTKISPNSLLSREERELQEAIKRSIAQK